MGRDLKDLDSAQEEQWPCIRKGVFYCRYLCAVVVAFLSQMKIKCLPSPDRVQRKYLRKDVFEVVKIMTELLFHGRCLESLFGL